MYLSDGECTLNRETTRKTIAFPKSVVDGMDTFRSTNEASQAHNATPHAIRQPQPTNVHHKHTSIVGKKWPGAALRRTRRCSGALISKWSRSSSDSPAYTCIGHMRGRIRECEELHPFVIRSTHTGTHARGHLSQKLQVRVSLRREHGAQLRQVNGLQPVINRSDRAHAACAEYMTATA